MIITDELLEEKPKARAQSGVWLGPIDYSEFAGYEEFLLLVELEASRLVVDLASIETEGN